MGMIKPFEKSLLVMGVLSTTADERPILSELEAAFGPISKRTEPAPFVFTDYYDQEMNGNPMRSFLVFSDPVDPSELYRIKIETNQIEDKHAFQNNRRINLDPGLLSLGSLILATTKNATHRIPLRDGIYAETTLIYHTHTYHALDWTYADYASDRFILFFNSLRQELKKSPNQK